MFPSVSPVHCSVLSSRIIVVLVDAVSCVSTLSVDAVSSNRRQFECKSKETRERCEVILAPSGRRMRLAHSLDVDSPRRDRSTRNSETGYVAGGSGCAFPRSSTAISQTSRVCSDMSWRTRLAVVICVDLTPPICTPDPAQPNYLSPNHH